MRAAYPLLDGSFRSGVGDPPPAGSGSQAPWTLRGQSAEHTRREILNTLAYWLRAGCAWRLLPHDLPSWQTVYHYWGRWQQEGVWEGMLTALRKRERAQLGRDPAPSAAVVDSQSVRASGRGGLHGYDGGKRGGGMTVEVVQRRDEVFRSTWARVGEPPPSSASLRRGPAMLGGRTGDRLAL